MPRAVLLPHRPYPEHAAQSVARSVQHLRNAARCLAGNRQEGDGLCEEALLAFLSSDPAIDEDHDYFPDLFRVLRKTHRSALSHAAAVSDPDPAFDFLGSLPLALREVAAVYLGSDLSRREIAVLLEREEQEIADQLDTLFFQLRSVFVAGTAAALAAHSP